MYLIQISKFLDINLNKLNVYNNDMIEGSLLVLNLLFPDQDNDN